MPSLPGLLLALGRAVPGLLAARALGEGLLVAGFAVALRAHCGPVTLELAAQALAPEIVGAVQHKTTLLTAAVRVDVLIADLQQAVFPWPIPKAFLPIAHTPSSRPQMHCPLIPCFNKRTVLALVVGN